MIGLPKHIVAPKFVLGTLFASAMVAAPAAHAADAGTCARSMARQTFDYLTPPPKDRDPRGQLPVEMTVEQRRALHTVLWPSDYSVRFSVSQWLNDRNFDCLEEAFADLEAIQARFPQGSMKVVSFLGAAQDFVGHRRGMTEVEIAELIADWRQRHPNSLLAELLSARMLMAAAWAVRGGDYASNVSPQNMREFRRLNELAMKQVRALTSVARQHAMGHYVGLRALTDNGATREQITQFALEGLRRFPAESGLALIAGQRTLPKWGGSNAEFEKFARAAMSVVGPAFAQRLYALLYVEGVGFDELHKHAVASNPVIKAGLMDLANLRTFEAIVALQEFACHARDAEALRHAQAQWAAYAAQTQLRAPGGELDARCRQWERTLPPAASPIQAASASAAKPDARHFATTAPLSAEPSLYRVADGPWQRMQTPVGELFTCTACEYSVEVLIAVGPPLGPEPDLTTNERFLAALRSRTDLAAVARAHIEKAALLDPARANYELKIDKTDFAEVDGVMAFRYESVLRFRQRTLRGTALELIHRGRMVRISVNRADGPVGAKEREAVLAFIAGIKLADK